MRKCSNIRGIGLFTRGPTYAARINHSLQRFPLAGLAHLLNDRSARFLNKRRKKLRKYGVTRKAARERAINPGRSVASDHMPRLSQDTVLIAIAKQGEQTRIELADAALALTSVSLNRIAIPG